MENSAENLFDKITPEMAGILFRTIIESSSDMIWAVDPTDHGLIYYNRGLYDYFLEKRGIRIEPGNRPEDLFTNEESIKTWHEFYQAALRDGSFRTEYHTASGIDVLDLRIRTVRSDEKVLCLSVYGRNITRQVQSEEKYKLAFMIGTDGHFWSRLRDAMIIETNPAFEQIFGYTHEEMIGKTAFDLQLYQDPADRAKMADAIGRQGSLKDLMITGRRKDGSTFPIAFSASTATIDGEINIMGVIRDISLQMDTEEALRKKEEKFRLAFMTGLDAYYWATMMDGKILEINPAFEELFGYPKDEAIGKTSLDLHLYDDPDDRARMLAELKEKGFVKDLVLKGRKKDGTVILVSMSVNKMAFEGVMHILGVLKDVTKKVATEKALRESEDLFRTSFESSIAGISMVGADGRFLKANAKLCEILGYDEEELLRMRFGEITHPDDRADSVSMIQAMFSGEIDNCSFEKRYLKKNGDLIWVQLSIAAIRDDAGRFRYFVTYTQDITQTKKSMELIQKTLEGSIETLARVIEARDPYTSGHQRRVTDIAQAIAQEMQLSETQMRGIYFASIIHDLGKIQIPSEILSKPGKLTDLEFKIIQTHPGIGYELLGSIDFNWPIAEIVHQHHERINGSGYPRGLIGAEMLPEARILAVADVAEAMTAHRPYRPSLGSDAAIEEIRSHRGVLYDEAVVDVFLKLCQQDDFLKTLQS